MAFLPSFLLLRLVLRACAASLPLDVQTRAPNVTAPPYELPQSSSDPLARSAAITTKQQTFLYGPPVGGGPFYPTGPLGATYAANDLAALQEDEVVVMENLDYDLTKATADSGQYNGLQTLADYAELYENEWIKSAPYGVDTGVLSNYTQDLLFSMERLSISPYAVRRLMPASDQLPFMLNTNTIQKISGMSLTSLFQSGRLFYVNHSSQATLTRTDKYGAACDAYFYIDSRSGNFLPLAIRTNVGSNLVYTPLDTANDWLLAKIMFNVNDFWFAQWNHLALSHEVVQIVYEAAIRTLSDDHPVLAIMQRLTYEVFAIQPVAKAVLFAPGAVIDQNFPWTGESAQEYTTNLYDTSAGAFLANYFMSDLTSRGLINSPVGPPLKSFPFYEDASAIFAQISKFMTAFVKSYYPHTSTLTDDNEVQAWVHEATANAKVIDFPPAPLTSTQALADILTHLAYLVSIAHHTINTNELITISSSLPFHPQALYHPIPTTKGSVPNVAAFLPPVNQSLNQIAVGALFARDEFRGSNKTIIHMFDDPAMLARMNPATRAAAAAFARTMHAFSALVSARAFDASGLSQGMPFVWKALDPNVAPYYVAT